MNTITNLWFQTKDFLTNLWYTATIILLFANCNNTKDYTDLSWTSQKDISNQEKKEDNTDKRVAEIFYAFQFTDNEADNFDSKWYKIDHAWYDKEWEILGYEKGDTIDITKKEILTDCNHDWIIDKKLDTREIVTPQEKKKISKIITRRAIIDEIH